MIWNEINQNFRIGHLPSSNPPRPSCGKIVPTPNPPPHHPPASATSTRQPSRTGSLVISSLLTADFSLVKTSVINKLGNCEEKFSRTDESKPRPKYIFNKCGTNIYFFTLQRFGPSTSPNFKSLNNYQENWPISTADI